jgi:N6-L-threonylcarbamoyladenine synthase
MNVLGIETSCDETAAAVVKDGRMVLSNIVVSSLKEHVPYGGIIPEIASRRQLEFINAVTARSLARSGLALKDIDAVAVTGKPGLIGSLLVGISFARALSFAVERPLIYVDHVKAHAYANFLEFSVTEKADASARATPRLPAVALVVSGGHTNLYHMKTFQRFRLLGHTLDDAAGESFDKVAKILNLGYPGGPVIDRLSKSGKNTRIRFKCAPLPDTYNFSFSGIKTAVLYHHRANKEQEGFSVSETVYAFQESVVGVLVQKCLAACRKLKTETLLIGGGVAANSVLRERLNAEAKKHRVDVYFPPFSVCTDNAAMIAGLGYHLINAKDLPRPKRAVRIPK